MATPAELFAVVLADKAAGRCAWEVRSSETLAVRTANVTGVLSVKRAAGRSGLELDLASETGEEIASGKAVWSVLFPPRSPLEEALLASLEP